MTGPRGTPRNASSADPPTPKSRAKPKSARSRSSPSQKKSSPGMIASAGVTSSIPTAAATAAAAAVAHQQALLAAQRAAAIHNASSAPKRVRSSGGGSAKEPDPKRAKPSSSNFTTLHSRPGVTKPPGSPTTSSWSRQRKSSKSRGNTTTSGEEASGGPPSRASSRPRPSSRASALPQQVSCFSVDGTSVTSIVPSPPLSKRLFGLEIQSLMHAFGEVRFCARDVLEMTEDAVRDAVIRTAIAAYQFATEETNGETTLPVGMRHVAKCMHGDFRAVYRLNQSLKQAVEFHKDKLPREEAERRFNALPPQWERFSELGFPSALVQTSDKPFHPHGDVLTVSSIRAAHIYKSVMPVQNFQDWLICRGVSLVRQDSKSRAPAIRGQPRISLFREWIGVEQNLKFSISDDGIIALGHVAWEAIGLITQTALLHRYFDDGVKGLGDPRAVHWSFPRRLIAALNHGVGTGILIPLNEVQSVGIRPALDTHVVALQLSPNRWRGYSGAVYPGLLPRDIREALRRLRRSPDSKLGLRGKSFLQSHSIM